jgi:ribose transport system substrate-binding protein
LLNYRNAFWGLVLVLVVAGLWKYQSVPGNTGESSPTKVVVITGGPGPYWQATIAGAQAAAQEFGLKLEVKSPSQAENLEQQMQLLASLQGTELAGIAVSPVDPDQETRLINRLASETTVITFDSDAPLSLRQGHVGASNYGAGRLCARLIHEAVPQGGKVAVLMANRTKANLLDRQSGLEENINRIFADEKIDANHQYQLLPYLVDEGDDARCAQLIRSTLAEHADLACFVGLNARHGPLLLEVLAAEGKLGQVQLVTFDDAEATLAGIEAGHIYATVVQNPYRFGYEAVRLLSAQPRDEGVVMPVVGSGSFLIPTEAIRKPELAEFRQRTQSPDPESTP